MSELLAQLARVRAQGAPAALATLIGTSGATPREPGATMCVGAGGEILGTVTIGGCVDARVIETAPDVIATGEQRVVTMALGDDDAMLLGLTCGGTVELLLQRVDPRDTNTAMSRAYDAAGAVVAEARAAIVATPLTSDERITIDENGTRHGTLGDRALDDAVASRAREMIAAAAPPAVGRFAHGGAEMVIWLEVLAPPHEVVIVGATDVAIALTRFLDELGMRTIVVDGRERFATRERFPCATEIRVGMPSEIVAERVWTARTAAVLLAHDYKYELPVLRTVLRSGAGYIGMLGGRKRGSRLRTLLGEEGFSDGELSRIHTPIGLDIGAARSAEIALAVAAQLVAAFRGRVPLR